MGDNKQLQTDHNVLPPGFIDDRSLRILLNANKVLRPGTWTDKNVHQASYGLRMDSKAELSRAADEAQTGVRSYTVLNIAPGDGVDLCPGDSVLLYSKEHFDLPQNILALTVPRGMLVAQSLLAGPSYADPGFSGQFCIPVTNGSTRVVTLKPDTEIVRAFFFCLARDVERAWSPADATSLRAHVESAPHQRAIAGNEAKKMSLEQLIVATQHGASPDVVAMQIAKRFRRDYFAVFMAAVLWPVALLIANSDGVQKSILGHEYFGFWSNVLAGLFTAIVVAVTSFAFGRLKNRNALEQ